ncbi:hypothetical protein [Pseudogemmobacter sp. W21_MBD1_M6]|jgi:hypothetical protein|uniref:hypothetical protein n=1 Tax=Pseudogemmobacter sp. W21_MBD1_M6 TaxID=3240271 RepID=UPI003F98F56F
MKRFIIASLITLGAATAASAMTANNELSQGQLLEVRMIAPTADVSNLTLSQAFQIETILANDKDNDVAKNGAIHAVLNRS